ncbi:uncharacterized protein BDR25DRAFT_305141 [Lindgomyces ingoldianus]|uniref:Uncharacterized protein n=1 Tax=Lindgomyces ingoldianus TaxID=673940 RepID=A0ACB6QMH4_9PLEO|nr:uncharacterized protein BDR25DRAFT_305141 [Lindgomyces ingoldianus]KAF2468138.1 hypothetical protein BDR25DRAFT_305141 [Lindgomyces ingoldianus]
MLRPPRRFLTEEEMKAIPAEERAAIIAEWSSFNARLRLQQQQQEEAACGSYRAGRGRGGRGRGGRGYYGYHPYASAQRFSNRSVSFNPPKTPPPPSRLDITLKSPGKCTNNQTAQTEQEEVEKSAEPCAAFTATGVCKKGPRCPHAHDPEKTAICKRYLYKDNCVYGDACPLSHAPSPHRSPTCTHFLEHRCTKENCRYAHVNVNPAAPVCEAFARRGYCEKGGACAERHAFECPDFTNKGSCEVEGCPFPHVMHAGRLRKAAGSHSTSEAGSPPTSSAPEKLDGNESAEDGTEQCVVNANCDIDLGDDSNNGIEGAQSEPGTLSHQADFVPFEA